MASKYDPEGRRAAILAALEYGPRSLTQLAEITRYKRIGLRWAVGRMVSAGELVRIDSSIHDTVYRLPAFPGEESVRLDRNTLPPGARKAQIEETILAAGGELQACDIETLVGVSPATRLYHLRRLKAEGKARFRKINGPGFWSVAESSP